MKLGLGTAQFGMDYGISRPGGKTDPDEVRRVLDVAAQNHIRIVDTAALYGTSEEVLGHALPANHGFSIVTKTPVFSGTEITADSARLVELSLRRSLTNMRLRAVYGLLIHHADDALAKGGNLLLEKMQELKRRGQTQKIGVSVYRAEQIDRVLDRFSIDIIQIPLNVFDQRLLRSGHLMKLKQAGIEIHARSVFLQGLLLMEPSSLPSYFDSIKAHLARYHEYLKNEGLTPVQGAIGFVAGLDAVDIVLCGVNNHLQLEEICSQWKPCDAGRFSEFAVSNEGIVDPSRWKIT